MDPKVVVPVKSAWKSKINWGVAVAMLASLGSFFGYDFDAETQAAVQTVIANVTVVYVWIMKTFFTTTITPSAVGTTMIRE